MKGKFGTAKIMIWCLLFAAVMMAGSAMRPVQAAEDDDLSGWQKIEGKYYYYEDGVKQKNKIVGNKTDGYYYVDKSGIRITTKEIRYAVEFVVKNSKPTQSRAAKLKSCYKVLLNYKYKGMKETKPSAKAMPKYATYMFKKKCGNCYRYASAMAYVGRVLGYETRVSTGRVSVSRRKNPVSPHGRCEIKIGGKWKILELTIYIHSSKKPNLYLLTDKNYPATWKCDHRFVLNAKNGKVTWKKTK